MSYYFLPEDFKMLNNQIKRIVERIKAIGREMGKSCQEGAETFHDNFAFEEGERQQFMWSKRLNELMEIKSMAVVFAPEGKSERVGIGRKVLMADCDTGEEKTILIGSYINFNSNGKVSYHAPLARIILGAKVGDCRQGMVVDKKRTFEILEII
jgi:transcription elongation GreA/GreB family factor